jgi:hypothetical protein
MRVAEENARANLILSIHARITSEFLHEKQEAASGFDETVQSRLASCSSLEVEGVRIARRDEMEGVAYALAVLSKDTGRERHAEKLERLDAQIESVFEQARRQETGNSLEEASGLYLSLYGLLAQREETSAVLMALGSTGRTGVAGGSQPSRKRAVSRSELTVIINRLTATENLRDLDDAAVALAYRLGRQVGDGSTLLVQPFTYRETQFTSPFSRYLAVVLRQKLAGIGLDLARLNGAFKPRTANYEREMASQTDAGLVVRGTYVETASHLKVFAIVTDVATGRKVAGADLEIPRGLIESERLDFLPQNFQAALQDAGLFAAGEIISGQLRVEAWTSRGVENVLLEEADQITLGLRVNQSCYLQLVYNMADGKRVLLYNNYYVDQSKVNHAIVLPDTFVVAPPLGVEVLSVFASTETFPEVRVKRWEGYDLLEDSLEQYVSGMRGLQKKRKAAEMAETRVTITTIAKSSSPH